MEHNSLNSLDLNESVNQYTTVLEEIYNRLAPRQSRWIAHRPHAPWYNSDLRLAKRKKRQAERTYRKTGLTVHKEIFTATCAEYNKLLDFHKSAFFKSKIEQTERNKLFRTINKLFQPGNTNLPAYTSLESLAENFNDFFYYENSNH